MFLLAGEIVCLWVLIKTFLCSCIAIIAILAIANGDASDDDDYDDDDDNTNTFPKQNLIDFLGINECKGEDMANLLFKIGCIILFVCVMYIAYKIIIFCKKLFNGRHGAMPPVNNIEEYNIHNVNVDYLPFNDVQGTVPVSNIEEYNIPHANVDYYPFNAFNDVELRTILIDKFELKKKIFRKLNLHNKFKVTECPICITTLTNNICKLPCGHLVCSRCFAQGYAKELSQRKKNQHCCMCRTSFKISNCTILTNG